MRVAPVTLVVASVLAAAAVPLAAGEYVTHLGAMILFFAYLGAAWNVLGGYAGQFSFGHAAFFGLGAYTSTLLSVHAGVSPWLGLIGAGVAGVTLGLVCGFLSFRYGLRGPYFALVMLAFAEMLRLVFETWMSKSYPLGMSIPLKGTSLVDFQFKQKRWYYWIALAMVVLVFWLCHRLARTRLGAYWTAIRDNEDAAEVLGVDVFRGKMIAMALSAGLTAVGGTFYAQYFLTLEVNEVFGTAVSVEILLSAIIGGAGTVFGPLVGAIVLQLVAETTRVWVRDLSGLDLVAYGLVLVLVIIFLPQGLLEGLRRPWTAVTRSATPTRAETAPGA